MNGQGSVRPQGARWALATGVAAAFAAALLGACGSNDEDPAAAQAAAAALAAQGREIFRHDTFGDETKWTDQLRLHEVVQAAVDPVTALAVGLKVDADALPAALVQGIRDGTVDLRSPATTVALLKLRAVIGLEGTVESIGGSDRLTRLGVTCALCHSTVDDSVAPGIGRRLDGWPNRDLDPGAIIALSPALDATTRATYRSWGKGRYDPRFNLDGVSKPLVIPPAYGLDGLRAITFTGDGDRLAYWNRYVAVTQMGGHGTMVESRLNINVTNGSDDRVGGVLAALEAYQLTLAAPPPPAASFDAAAAARGRAVFDGPGQCAGCHAGAQFTDANTTLHAVADSMAEPEVPSYAARTATKRYRSSPLRGVWQHPPYFHDGSAATLEAVVQRYDSRRALGLGTAQKADLVQYLKSL